MRISSLGRRLSYRLEFDVVVSEPTPERTTYREYPCGNLIAEMGGWWHNIQFGADEIPEDASFFVDRQVARRNPPARY